MTLDISNPEFDPKEAFDEFVQWVSTGRSGGKVIWAFYRKDILLWVIHFKHPDTTPDSIPIVSAIYETEHEKIATNLLIIWSKLNYILCDNNNRISVRYNHYEASL